MMIVALAAAILLAATGAAALEHGDLVYLTVPRSGHRVTAESGGEVHAKWKHRGLWQRFALERAEGPGEVRIGDTVLLRAWTGKRLTVQGQTVHARWDHAGVWQKFVLEAKGVDGAAQAGATIFLRAHTGARLDADAPDSPGVVQARWSHQGAWQELLLEAHGGDGTTGAPRTTEAPATTTTARDGAGAARPCAELRAEDLAEALTVRTVELPAPISGDCGGSGIKTSCRHGFYAASPRTDLHAFLYNDAAGRAMLLLLGADDAVLRSAEVGAEEVRGLQFDPSGQHLVALVSGGTGIQNAASMVTKLRVPSLEVVWTMPVESPLVGMELWTPDNSDAIAVSEDRYVLHSAGVCRSGKWCAGAQGDLTQVLDATTGAHLLHEGRDWRVSHSCKQMIGYNSRSDTFLLANAGDSLPKALEFATFAQGAHSQTATRVDGWGNGDGRQGVTLGAIKPEPAGEGFAAVWSYGTETGADEVDKLWFAGFRADGSLSVEPKLVFPSSAGTQIGGNLASLGADRWLLAYTEAEEDAVTRYLTTFWDNWRIPEEVRASGGRLAVLDARGEVLGRPVDIAALGAPFPVEINHLVERPSGIGWLSVDGVGARTATVAQLRCDRRPQ